MIDEPRVLLYFVPRWDGSVSGQSSWPGDGPARSRDHLRSPPTSVAAGAGAREAAVDRAMRGEGRHDFVPTQSMFISWADAYGVAPPPPPPPPEDPFGESPMPRWPPWAVDQATSRRLRLLRRRRIPSGERLTPQWPSQATAPTTLRCSGGQGRPLPRILYLQVFIRACTESSSARALSLRISLRASLLFPSIVQMAGVYIHRSPTHVLPGS
jgi:hypothetical protein